jgi:hypothetical protein
MVVVGLVAVTVEMEDMEAKASMAEEIVVD